MIFSLHGQSQEQAEMILYGGAESIEGLLAFSIKIACLSVLSTALVHVSFSMPTGCCRQSYLISSNNTEIEKG